MDEHEARRLAATLIRQFDGMVELHNSKCRPENRITKGDTACMGCFELQKVTDAIVAVLTNAKNRPGYRDNNQGGQSLGKPRCLRGPLSVRP